MIPPLVVQGDREAGLRPREKGTHSLGGNQATAPKSVGVGEIRGDKAASDALLHTRWITAGEPVALRGVHDLREGKTL